MISALFTAWPRNKSPSQPRSSLTALLSLNWNIVIILLVWPRLAIIARQMMWKSNRKPLPGDSFSWLGDMDHERYKQPMCLWRVIQVVAKHCLRAIDLHCLKGIWLNKWQHMVDESDEASGERERWHCFQREKGCSERGWGGGISSPLQSFIMLSH